MDVYKKQDIPDNLHYKNNVRIGDLIIVTKIGYTVYISNQSVNWTVNSKLKINKNLSFYSIKKIIYFFKMVIMDI